MVEARRGRHLRTLDKKPTAARLFIIGAGASYGAGMPDASRVLPQIFNYIRGPWFPVANRSPLGYFRPLADPLLEVMRHLGGGDRFPLDELSSAFHNAAKRDPPRYVPLLAMFYQAMQELLYQRSCECAAGLETISSQLRAGDVVITFNWDLCLEIVMASRAIPFSRALSIDDRPDCTRLLKIHGSLDDLVVKYGATASIGPHSIVDRYEVDAPPPYPGFPRHELVRLLTYDLPLRGALEWNEEKRAINLRILGDRNSKPIVGETDLFPLQLQRLLGESAPWLLTPANPRLQYDWSYDLVRRIVTGIRRSFASIVVVGYSFPDYDEQVYDLLAEFADHLGHPPAHVVNPAASSLSLDLLKRLFGSVELHASTAEKFDWMTLP